MHNFWEIVYADKQSMYITAGAEEILLPIGHLYIHKPNEFHKIRCDGVRAANSVIVSFDCDCPELMNIAGMVIAASSEEKALLGAIIREGATQKLADVITGGKQLGMQFMDDAIWQKLQQGLVTPEEAYMKAIDKARFKNFLPPDKAALANAGGA